MLGHAQECNLSFEGFLEALVRLACIVPLPTDGEIAASGCSDAARFMAYMRSSDGKAYAAMLHERASAARFGELPSTQPIERCLQHLLVLLMRLVEGTVEAIAAGGGDVQPQPLELTEGGIRAFLQRHGSAPRPAVHR